MRILDIPINPNLKLSDRYSLRGNPVVPLIEKMQNEIKEKGPIAVQWGGTEKIISRVVRTNLGDLFLEGGSATPRVIRQAGLLVEQNYNHNYSASLGYFATRKAKQEFYLRRYNVEIPLNRILIGEGVTAFMHVIARMFLQSAGSKSPTFGAPGIGYPPWAGTLMQYGIFPIFYPVDSSHYPQVDANRLDETSRFVLLYSLGNPGGIKIDEQTVASAAQEIRKFMEMHGKSIVLVIDDAYWAFLRDKGVDFFKIAKEYKIPMILLSGIDKPLGTGFHGGAAVVYVPPEMENTAKTLDYAIASLNSQYLGTSTNTQFKMMVYDLILAGYAGKDIKKWIENLPRNEPTPRWTGTRRFERILRKYDDMELFKHPETLVEDIDKNLQKHWGWAESVLSNVVGDGKLVSLHGERPDVPFYLFLQLKSGPWENSNQFSIDLAKNTGIAVSPGDSFIADEFLAGSGMCFRIAVATSPNMLALDGSGKNVNYGKVIADFINARNGGL